MTDTFENFDFMAEPLEEEPPLDQHEDDSKKGKLPQLTTNKDFAQSVLNVFTTLGGEDWLHTQAKVDPKTYLNMLSKMIPKSIDADDLQGLSLMIVDQYLEGDRVIHVHRDDSRSPALPASAAPVAAGGGPSELGQPASTFETATSGNPIEVIEVFE